MSELLKNDREEEKFKELLETLTESQVDLRKRQGQLYDEMKDLMKLLADVTDTVKIVKSDVWYLINTLEVKKPDMKTEEEMRYIG